MLGLYLVAAHLVGDFALQTRWQAGNKFTDRAYRARHVLAYCLPFVPIAAVYAHEPPGGSGSRAYYAVVFLVALAVLHYLTDSRRLTSTPGEWVVWVLGVWLPSWRERRRPVWTELEREKPMPTLRANPWPPLPILLDQTLHAAQLAVLGGLFLS